MAATPLDTLGRTRESTTALCALPAVATLDWFDRAAAALCGAAPGATCVLMLASVDGSGVVAAPEAVGVAASNGDASGAEATLTSLRSRAHRLTGVGFAPGNAGLARTTVGEMDRLAPDWRSGPVGRLWTGPPAGGLICALAPLNAAHGQMLLAHLACHREAIGAQAVLEAVLPLLLQRAARCIGPTLADSHCWLTAREQEVLEQLTRGRSVKQIAGALGRSPHTVHDHVKALHRKLRANTRGELIARALGHISAPAPTRAAVAEVEPKGPSHPVMAGVPRAAENVP